MRVLRTIVPPATGFLSVANAEVLERSAIGTEAIRHQFLGATVPLEEFQRSDLLASTLIGTSKTSSLIHNIEQFNIACRRRFGSTSR